MSDITLCPYCFDGQIPKSAECCMMPVGNPSSPECCGDPDFIYEVCDMCDGTAEIDKQVLMELILRGNAPPHHPDALFDEAIKH